MKRREATIRKNSEFTTSDNCKTTVSDNRLQKKKINDKYKFYKFDKYISGSSRMRRGGLVQKFTECNGRHHGLTHPGITTTFSS